MRPPSFHNTATRHKKGDTTLAKALAPEEIRRGDFVTPLHVVHELPSFLWCVDSHALPLDEPVRVQWMPAAAGLPLKVRRVCLPFVLVRLPWKIQRTLDLRRYRLARLDVHYAKASWKAYQRKHRPDRRTKR